MCAPVLLQLGHLPPELLLPPVPLVRELRNGTNASIYNGSCKGASWVLFHSFEGGPTLSLFFYYRVDSVHELPALDTQLHSSFVAAHTHKEKSLVVSAEGARWV